MALHAANALNDAFGDDDDAAESSAESSDEEPAVPFKRPEPVKRKAAAPVPENRLSKIAKTDAVRPL